MARVFKFPNGYEFIHLSNIGRQLVNEFQRHYPQLVEPTQEPGFRFVRFESSEQELLIDKLVADVLQRDPEPKWRPKPRGVNGV